MKIISGKIHVNEDGSLGVTLKGENGDFQSVGMIDPARFQQALDILAGTSEIIDDSEEPSYDDSMDGDHASALASAGFGTDEDYGSYGGDYE